MASNSTMKLKLLYLMKILLEKTDESHSITVQEIILELEKYGVSAERKSIYTDLELLRHYGLDIIAEKFNDDKENKKANYYRIVSRDFELPELRILIDAVQSSRFITPKKTDELIKKIQKLTSVHEARDLQRQVIIHDRVKTTNENIYYSIDALHKAIQLMKKVQFKYLEYNVEKKQSLKRDGANYEVSPYALSWTNEHYYLIGYYDRYEGICHFRVDRMVDIRVVHDDRAKVEATKDFNVVEYSKKYISMFAGEQERVEIEFDRSLINVVIDQFGLDVKVISSTDTRFRIEVYVAVTPTLLGWLFMFGNQVKVISPHSFVERMRQAAKDVVGEYGEG